MRSVMKFITTINIQMVISIFTLSDVKVLWQ